MSMRRPRIKPQVNLASTRRRPNAAAATTKPAAAAATTTSTTTTSADATKSDTQHEDVNEENATNATPQLADKPPETTITTTTTLESNNEENQVQVSVIDYNVPTEDANSSTTEYVVTIKNEPETSPIKPATKTVPKKPAFKKIKPNLIRTTRKPKETVGKKDITIEADSAVQGEKEGEKPSDERDEVNFKVPTTVAQESETQSGDPSSDVLQKDMQREAEELRTPLREEATQETEEGRLNGENGEYGEKAASATLENIDIHPIKWPHPEYHHMSTSLPGSPIPHPNRPFFPAGSRLRTESSCSVFSDSLASTGTQKATRRIDEQKRQQRAQARKIFANGPPDKTVMKMSDLIYYNPPTKPMDIKSLPPPQAAKDPKISLAEAENDKEEEPSAQPQKSIVPQLKLNAAGELVLDDTSLEIETTAEQQAKKTLANSSLIYVDEYTGMNGFYKRRPRTREWPREETVKFYRCLQVIGTDFSCMLQLFPNRTRRDLKLKFKKEERVNGQLINKAILNPKTFNVEDLKTQLENEEKERQENDKKWKEFMAKNPKPKKVKDGKSVGGRVLKHGDHIYETEKKQVESTNKRKRTYNKKQVPKAASDENASEVGNEAQAPPKEVKHKPETNGNEPGKPKPRKRKQKKTDENANMENLVTNPEDTKQAEIEGGEVPKKRRRGRPKADPKGNSLVPVLDPISIKAELQNTQTTSADAAAKENGNENGEGTVDRAELEAELDTLTANEAENGEEHLKQSVSEPKVSTKDESAHLQKKELHESLGIKTDTLQLDSINIDSDDDDSNSAQDAVSLLFALGAPKSPPKPSPPTPRQTYCELGEEEIASILRQIAEGSMALVSTLDPTDPDKVLNEIYAIDQDTGELSNEPLNVPDELVQSILEVMS